jgi:hypothetical protein
MQFLAGITDKKGALILDVYGILCILYYDFQCWAIGQLDALDICSKPKPFFLGQVLDRSDDEKFNLEL